MTQQSAAQTRTRPLALKSARLALGLVAWTSVTLALYAQSPTAPVQPPLDQSAALAPAKLAEMDAAIQRGVDEKNFPGGVLWVEHRTNQYHKAYGRRALLPTVEAMTEDTIFDAASLTKVMATAPSIMRLWEQGRVRLDEPVVTYLPEFASRGKDKITIRHLLTHTSGLNAGLGRSPDWKGYDKAIALACGEKPTDPPGMVCRYSDINFIVLGEVVRRVSGKKLNEFAADEIFGPLGMDDTGFLPPAEKLNRIAPTEQVGSQVLRGVVHDPTALRMGGVAGHAGVFTTASDLARMARMYLHEGTLEGVQILKPDTIRLMTSVQSPPTVDARRGLGWDIDSDYSRPRGSLFPLGSYGHTGFTGVCLWIDPFSNTFWMFLSNRVHPTRAGNVLPLQRTLANLSAEAVQDFNFSRVPGALTPRATNGPAKK